MPRIITFLQMWTNSLIKFRRKLLNPAKTRSGYLKIWGKRQKYREVPLNSTARKTLSELQLEIAPEASDVVFVSVRTKGKLTTRAIGFIRKTYAERAGLDIHPHDSRHRFGYRMAQPTPLHRLAQIMGYDSDLSSNNTAELTAGG